MKTLVATLAVSVFCTTLMLPNLVSAATQSEMKKACKAEAKTLELKGQERKDFIKSCLSRDNAGDDTGDSANKGEGKALTPQQAKMKKCNADAREQSLKGQDRKAFMKNCLSS